MLGDGCFAGLLIGCAFCGVIVLIVIFEGKKSCRKLEKILEQLPKEDKDKIRMSGFYEYNENANFLVGSSIIYEIVDHTDDIEIKLVFYDNTSRMYRLDFTHINKDIHKKRDFKVGQIVETIHNTRPEVWLRVRTIL